MLYNVAGFCCAAAGLGRKRTCPCCRSRPPQSAGPAPVPCSSSHPPAVPLLLGSLCQCSLLSSSCLSFPCRVRNCLFLNSVDRSSGQHGLSFLIPCLHFPKSVGPQRFWGAGGPLPSHWLPGSGRCKPHFSNLQRKSCRCPGENVRLDLCSSPDCHMLVSGKYTPDCEYLVQQPQ